MHLSKMKIINKEVFQREIEMCKKLSGENKGRCKWGICKDCGVVPLLIKLHKGILLEDKGEIKKEKAKILDK